MESVRQMIGTIYLALAESAGEGVLDDANKIITNAINTARTGGQSHITVVGHTDTSGSAAYNQRLSVRRANVVVEALVDMGARRAAIQASGVGKTDLAVPTPDGVKEAKNRRSVIALIP